MNSISWHPVLAHFLTGFKNREGCSPPGICTGNMNDSIFKKQVNMKGSYLACAKVIHLHPSQFIHFTGPGGGLVAARKLNLESPEIVFEGDEAQPIQLVGIEEVAIRATSVKIKNVVIYLFADAKLKMDAQRFTEVKNVKVVCLKLEGTTLVREKVADWPNLASLRRFISSDNLDEEHFKWQKEIVDKIGLRSILV